METSEAANRVSSQYSRVKLLLYTLGNVPCATYISSAVLNPRPFIERITHPVDFGLMGFTIAAAVWPFVEAWTRKRNFKNAV